VGRGGHGALRVGGLALPRRLSASSHHRRSTRRVPAPTPPQSASGHAAGRPLRVQRTGRSRSGGSDSGHALGVTALERLERALVPAEFTAATRKVYRVPFTSPVTVVRVVVPFTVTVLSAVRLPFWYTETT
jgi:hypothetical protein